MDPKEVALQFNECINNRDIDGLCSLMAEDHIMIDSAENSVEGKEENRKNWIKFFRLFPVYRNTFRKVTAWGNLVLMEGFSTCPGEPLLHNVDAIWLAVIEAGKLKQWRIYSDSAENRKKLGL